MNSRRSYLITAVPNPASLAAFVVERTSSWITPPRTPIISELKSQVLKPIINKTNAKTEENSFKL